MITMRMAGVSAAVVVMTVCGAETRQLDACTVVTRDDAKAALGRHDVGAAKAGRASGGYSECTLPGMGAGDVRILLGAPNATAAADFALKAQILTDERKTFQKLSIAGSPAYYYEDRIEFLAGSRDVAIWINRTARTEGSDAVQAALVTLATQAASRLRAR